MQVFALSSRLNQILNGACVQLESISMSSQNFCTIIDANNSAAKVHHMEQTMPKNTNLRPSFCVTL